MKQFFFFILNIAELHKDKMANSLSIDNCLIQVRARLQDQGIKLWLEPYYIEGIGPIDSELEVKTKNKK